MSGVRVKFLIRGQKPTRPLGGRERKTTCTPPAVSACQPLATRVQTTRHPSRTRLKGDLLLTRPSKFAARATTDHLKALLFDCDGVILESEELHRVAYNATFQHFEVRPGGSGKPIADWSVDFYDKLQNSIGGGKPKMRWYFGEQGWPSSTVMPSIPADLEEQAHLIDTLQDWKTAKYQAIIAAGQVEPRPGILQLFDEARAEGLKIGVCSAATKSSAICVLESLLGLERFQALDVFMAGDDVVNKKPDPSIYVQAAQHLQVKPGECLVIEDSMIGLQAARAAGMRCIVTFTSSTSQQNFEGAERVLNTLEQTDPPLSIEALRTVSAID